MSKRCVVLSSVLLICFIFVGSGLAYMMPCGLVSEGSYVPECYSYEGGCSGGCVYEFFQRCYECNDPECEGLSCLADDFEYILAVYTNPCKQLTPCGTCDTTVQENKTYQIMATSCECR